MKIKQLSVYLENKPGDLSVPCKALADSGITVTVGLVRFASSFCTTTAGRRFPTSEPTTGSRLARYISPLLIFILSLYINLLEFSC